MIRAWLLDYRPLPQSLASAAAATAAALPDHLAQVMTHANGRRPEWALLATCHRCEVYTCAASTESMHDVLQAQLPPAAGRALTALHGDAAARHLMRVAAGLESMLLGETDVQHQVVAALAQATELGSAGPVLNALFRAAIHAGKRVRTVTSIGRHATSLAPAAVDLVAARLGSMSQAQALVFGAGTMAQRACERLHALGIGGLTVTNRTLARAEHLAATCGGRAVPWEGGAGALSGADVAIAATAAPKPFIDGRMLRTATAARPLRPLHLVDLALPQNVQPDGSASAGVCYYDFADLEAATRASHAARAAEVPRAEAAIEQELARLRTWLQQRAVAPTLRLLGELATAARDAELERAWRRLPGLSTRERRVVESLAHNLAQRLVRRPLTRLRAAAGSEQAEHYGAVLEDLFADPAPHGPSGAGLAPDDPTT
jgi:glutamyl-tRNA reductase